MNMFHTVNLHFTEYCNYNCIYCFANTRGEESLAFSDWCQIVDRIKHYFQDSEIENGRINLVGGEPLIMPYIGDLIKYISNKGLNVSLITNGSLLTKEFISSIKNHITTIGISVDSISDKTNRRIGRYSRNQCLDTKVLIELCQYIKSYGIQLKVNTVVSKLNFTEDLNSFYDAVRPDRLKLLQVYIIDGVNDYSKHLVPTPKEFQSFVLRHLKHNPVVESIDLIDNAYLMVDAKGNLFTNKNNEYQLIGSTLEEDFTNLVHKGNIDAVKFYKRYKPELFKLNKI